MHAGTMADYHQLFSVNPSVYWKNHYVFDKESKAKNKKTSRSFIELLVVNAVFPFLFTFHRYRAIDPTEQLLALASEILPEKNRIIDQFSTFGLPSNSSYDSQAFLQLKKHYCDFNRCLTCAIGQKLINFTSIK
jgi:hypothetical protein